MTYLFEMNLPDFTIERYFRKFSLEKIRYMKKISLTRVEITSTPIGSENKKKKNKNCHRQIYKISAYRTPSSFSLIHQPVGSTSSLHVSAKRTRVASLLIITQTMYFFFRCALCSCHNVFTRVLLLRLCCVRSLKANHILACVFSFFVSLSLFVEKQKTHAEKLFENREKEMIVFLYTHIFFSSFQIISSFVNQILIYSLL